MTLITIPEMHMEQLSSQLILQKQLITIHLMQNMVQMIKQKQEL